MVCFYGFQCNSSAVCESLKGFFFVIYRLPDDWYYPWNHGRTYDLSLDFFQQLYIYIYINTIQNYTIKWFIISMYTLWKTLIFRSLTGARLDARTYTFAHPKGRTTNAARKQGAISPILPVFCRYYLCDAIMLIKLSMMWPWVTGKTTQAVAIVIVNFARDARMNTVIVCRMRERIKQDARTSLLMRERTHIVRWGSFH